MRSERPARGSPCRMKTENCGLEFPRIRRSLLLKIACFLQANHDNVFDVLDRLRAKRRSGCPVSISLEMLGDRWSLLVIRDLMVRGLRTFKEFHESGEGIATNILADRLEKLEAAGIILGEVEATDARRIN